MAGATTTKIHANAAISGRLIARLSLWTIYYRYAMYDHIYWLRIDGCMENSVVAMEDLGAAKWQMKVTWQCGIYQECRRITISWRFKRIAIAEMPQRKTSDSFGDYYNRRERSESVASADSQKRSHVSFGK